MPTTPPQTASPQAKARWNTSVDQVKVVLRTLRDAEAKVSTEGFAAAVRIIAVPRTDPESLLELEEEQMRTVSYHAQGNLMYYQARCSVQVNPHGPPIIYYRPLTLPRWGPLRPTC